MANTRLDTWDPRTCPGPENQSITQFMADPIRFPTKTDHNVAFFFAIFFSYARGVPRESFVFLEGDLTCDHFRIFCRGSHQQTDCESRVDL